MDVAKCYIEKNVDREGVEKRFINHYIGEKVSYDDSSAELFFILLFIICCQMSKNVYDMLMYGVWS